MRKRDSPKNGCDRGVSVPGVFKLDTLLPVEVILIQNFLTFLTFILGAPIYYYPRDRKGKQQWLEMGKRDAMRPRAF